jgi:hypothetical protein
LRVLAIAAVALALAGCAGDEKTATRPPQCTELSTRVPCTSARVGVDYPLTLHTHCGITHVYLDGRYWTIEPPQPGSGANTTSGVVQLVARHLAYFRVDGGPRYAFAPAPPDFRPPPCY